MKAEILPYNCSYCRKHGSYTLDEYRAHESICPDNPRNIPSYRKPRKTMSSSWPSNDFDCLGNHIREMGDGMGPGREYGNSKP